MQNPRKMVINLTVQHLFGGKSMGYYGLLHGKSLGKSAPDQKQLCFLMDNPQPRLFNRALFQKGALKSLAAFSPLKLPFRGNSPFSDTSILYFIYIYSV